MTSNLHPLMAAICEDILAAPKVLREAQAGRLSHDPSPCGSEKATLALLADLQQAIEQAEHKPGEWRSAMTQMGGISTATCQALDGEMWRAGREEIIASFPYKRDSWLAVAAVNALPELMRLAATTMESAAPPKVDRTPRPEATARIDLWDQAVCELAKARETGAEASTLRRLESAEEMARDAVYEARDIEPKPLFGEDE